MNKIFKKIKGSKSNIFWLVTAFFAIIGLIAIWSLNIYKVENGIKNHLKRDPLWKEYIMLPFYFTTLSALFALVYSIIHLFGFIKNIKIQRKLEIFVVANLILTFLIYWSVVFPSGNSKGIGWLHNIVLHICVPVFGVIGFSFTVIENLQNEKKEKINIWLSPLLHLGFMISWFAIVLIIYYSFGAKTGDAMYKFLDFKNAKSLVMPLVIIFGSGLIYYFTSVGLTFLSNKTKIQKK